RSMATGEVTYAGAVAYVVGELSEGFKQMMEMVNGSRLSNAMRAAGIMRRALLESLVHARQRVAFGRSLVELPLLRSNLLSMLLDAEAAASVILNGAALLDRREGGSPEARALARVWTPLAKYWITLRARDVTAEAMNIRGGNGYVEEWVNPRLLRDAFLGAIWEGSANVVALDVQRAILKDGGLEALTALVTERLGRVGEPAAKPWVDLVKATLEGVTRQAAGWAAQPAAERELAARPVADTLYHLLAGSLLLAEGQLLRERDGSYRKLLAAGLYLRRWLEPRGPAHPAFTARQVEWLEPLAEWRPIAAPALADVD
ncbi:MAG TPA: acyl-CoA dehydrogenase family protein, partial [Methylomirabilota bacterium]|nr:acyl-CoA dehydrogenase family protein [Methylomirabilota bacterium]